MRKTGNREIWLLPPYSPQLNPVESLWKFIKGNFFKNDICEDLDEAEQNSVL